MGHEQEVHTIAELRNSVRSVFFDLYAVKEMYDQWRADQQFVGSDHLALDVVTAAPSPGDLDAGEAVLGDGTGPNGRDEMFWSVDGETVARVEAD